MEDEEWKYGSRDQTSNDPTKGSRKARKTKSSGSKSKKKNSKIPPQKNTHSNTAARDLDSNDSHAVEAGEQAGRKDVERAAIEENILSNEAAAVSPREESPSKRSRSKSRSRSGSRSRFSNFFRRKKKCVSETDLDQNINDEADKRYESREHVEGTERPKTLALREDGEAMAGTSLRRGNLKSTSPHHSYDSRIQPRDRLLNMTVADAVKEQQLRRAYSANRYSPRRRDPTSSTSAFMFLSSPSLAAAMIASDADRRTFATTTTSSTLPAMKSERQSAVYSAGNANSLPTSGLYMDTEDGTAVNVAKKEMQPSGLGGGTIEKDITHKDVLESHITNSNVEPQKQPQKDLVNDHKADTVTHRIRPTEIKHEALISSQSSQNDHQQPSHSSPAHRMPAEEATEARMKRKASLSHFLELRQTLPPILSRAHRLSQSSDSGVTSRDTSPCTHPVYPEVKHRPQEQHSSHLDQDAQWKDKSPNPYVVSSISVSPSSIRKPSLSMNGETIQTDLKENEIVTNRPTVLKLEDSMAESSSMSSSPQMNSMTSSFRSSDQGYVETDSEDEASFATPPEEVESSSSTKREKSGRTFHPSIFEKLLETSREYPPREQFPEPDREFVVTRRQISNHETEFLQGFQPTQGPLSWEEKRETKSRYIPRGVRRSQSDVDSRNKSSRRIYKRSSKPEDGPQRIGSADGFSMSPDLNRDKVTFDMDKLSTPSTVTLTNQDGFELDLLNVERTDQKLVPVMGTMAQQRYRRTYSPSRVRNMIPISKDENITLPGLHISTSPKQILVKEVMTPVGAATLQHQDKNDPQEKNLYHLEKKSELSPSMPRKGILKSPMKDKMVLPYEENKESLNKPDSNIKPAPKSETSLVNEHLTENKEETLVKTENKIQSSWKADKGEQIMPEIETTGQTTPTIETKKGTMLKKQKRKDKLPKLDTSKQTTPKLDVTMPTPIVQITFDNSPNTDIPSNVLVKDSVPKTVSSQMQMASPVSSVFPIEKSHSASDIMTDTHTCSVTEGTTDLSTGSDNNLTIDFPLIHGLEVGMHKVHTFSGYSLTDYLKEQSKVNWKQQTISQKEKEPKISKSSLKKKATANVESRKQTNDTKIHKKETHEQIPKSTQEVTFFEHIVKDNQNDTLKTMVDKECQTSAWLINALVRNKSTKTKKKVSSFSKKKKQQHQHRRGSTVSDTFIPTDIKRHKESFQHSSLGDIRHACSKDTNFPNKLVRGSSEKAGRYRDNKTGIVTPIAGSSAKSHTDNKNDESPLPKPKKLSLSAVILLKNRLAKYREKKRNERPPLEMVEDETGLTRVSSDTLITIENELNLSKLEVSKETDIIDDDFYEPEFSLGYTRKQLRFEALPNEPMQGEEPLPPLPTSRRMRQRRESTLRERKRKCIQYCKKFIAFLFSHIGLCSLVVAYTILGGFIFQALENQAEYKVRSTIRDNREKVVGKLVALAVELQKTERGMENFTGEVNSTILEHQTNVHRLTKDKGWDGVEGVDEEGLWTFASSLLYAITVTTTIGYGHVAPKTPEGRIVTIGYAVVGIPLTLLCLTNIGDVMATGFRLLYGKICCGVCCTLFKPRRRRIQVDLEKGLGGPIVTTEEEQSDKPKEVIHVPTSLCLLLIAGYIFAGAMLFSMWESWDILTGSYFCFITLSTIGFGDIVPGMDSNAWAAEEKLVLCALYLVLGLSLIAMCFNLVQEDVKAKCRWLGMKLGIVEKHETPL